MLIYIYIYQRTLLMLICLCMTIAKVLVSCITLWYVWQQFTGTASVGTVKQLKVSTNLNSFWDIYFDSCNRQAYLQSTKWIKILNYWKYMMMDIWMSSLVCHISALADCDKGLQIYLHYIWLLHCDFTKYFPGMKV